MARGHRFSDFRWIERVARLDVERLCHGQNLRLHIREFDIAYVREGIDGPLPVDGFFERIDDSALHDSDGHQQTRQHGPGAETAAPRHEQSGKDEERHPEIEAGKDGPRLVEPGQSAIGVEQEK